MWLFLLFVGVPLIEIALFIEVGGLLGLWPTLGIVVATALIGSALLRAQGTAAWGVLQNRLRSGQDPSGALAHGALILVAGIVLLTPGFFTDALGLALLLPPVRSVVIRFLAARMTVVHGEAGHGPGRGAPPDDPGKVIVEGDFEEVDPGDARRDGDRRSARR